MSIAAFALLVMHLNAIGQVESDGTIVVAKWTPETIKKELEKIGGMAIDGLEDYIISNGIFADFEKGGTLVDRG